MINNRIGKNPVNQSQCWLFPASLTQERLWAGGGYLPSSRSQSHFPTVEDQICRYPIGSCLFVLHAFGLLDNRIDVVSYLLQLCPPSGVAIRENCALCKAELCGLALALACPWKWGADLILAVQTCQWQHKIWVKYLSARFSVCLSAWIKKRKRTCRNISKRRRHFACSSFTWNMLSFHICH